MDNITVSLDGPRFIHDKQRPQANSKSTFQRTFATANYFYQYRNKLNFGLRATLTPEYIDYLPELVRFVGLHFPKAQFSVEPVEFVGRFSEHPRDMFKNLAFSYRKARLEAVRHGLCFWYSVVRGPRKSDFFCGIAGRTMMVGPTGAITGCSRVSRPSFTGASHFIYGNVNTKSHVITIDKNAKARMETYAATNMSECDGCIAFTWCRGDCRHIRFMENKDILSGVSSRCREIRTIVVGELLDAAGFPDTDTYLNHYYTTTAGIRLNNEKINDEVSPAGNFMFNNRKIAIAR